MWEIDSFAHANIAKALYIEFISVPMEIKLF